jgi:DNA-binding PadR family transcriptional regulator
MSQIYTELGRLTSHGLVEPTTSHGEGRRTTTYRITEAGRSALSEWMAGSPVGFPVLKHSVLLRLLIGHMGEPERIREMLEEYVAELAVARADLREVREALRGSDAPGEVFHYPSVVADWGLDYFAAEARHTRKALQRLSSATDR